MISPSLLSESHRLLDQARMIAEAPAAQTSVIGHGHASSQMPPGAFASDLGSTLEACGERINRAIAHDSNAELAAANRWATTELEALTHSSAAGAESAVEFRVRVCENYEGILAGVVARSELTSVTTVRKLRAEDGRDPRLGHKLSEGEGR